MVTGPKLRMTSGVDTLSLDENRVACVNSVVVTGTITIFRTYGWKGLAGSFMHTFQPIEVTVLADIVSCTPLGNRLVAAAALADELGPFIQPVFMSGFLCI